MKEFKLLKSQKNELFQLIKKQGLLPSNFKWELTRSEYFGPANVEKLICVDTPLFIQFDLDPKGAFAILYSERDDRSLLVPTFIKKAKDWKVVLNLFKTWLLHLEPEVSKPDLWAQIEKFQASPESQIRADISNEPFNVKEVDRIVEAVVQMGQYLRQHINMTGKQNELVKKELEYLIGAARRQGRKDWLYTAIGATVTIMTALTLSPEQARPIWALIKSALSGVIQFLP